MWKWIAYKIQPFLTVGEVQAQAEEVLVECKKLRSSLEDRHRELVVGTANLQEEVFLLRDGISVMADLLGMEVSYDLDTNTVECIPSEKQNKVFQDALDESYARQAEHNIKRAATALAVAVDTAVRREKKIATDDKENDPFRRILFNRLK